MRRLRDLRGTQAGGLAGDSMYVALWQGSTTAADLLQIALITHILGLEEFGRLALITSVVVMAGQLLDVRVGGAATTFGARWLSRDPRGAVGLFQLTFLVDLGTGVVSFLVVVGLSPLIAPALIDDHATGLMALFALSLLAGTLDETSASLLRLVDRFRWLAVSTIALEVVRVGLVALALVVGDGLGAVLLALVVAQALKGAVYGIVATRALRQAAPDVSLRQSAIGVLGGERREVLRMMLHTNTVSYARLAQVQLPTIIVGAIAGTREVGLYKIGMAVAVFVGRLADPAYGAILPRLSRLWASDSRDVARRLVLRATQVAAPVLLAVLVVVVLLRLPLLELVGDEGAREAGDIVLAAAAGYTVNGILFWNVAVLYVSGESGYVSRVAIACAVAQVAMLPPLVLWQGALGAALAVLATMLLTNAVMTPRALRRLRGP